MENKSSKQTTEDAKPNAEKENSVKKKEKKESRKSRSRSRDKRRSRSFSPEYPRRRFGGRNRSRERSPARSRGRGGRRDSRSRERSRERFDTRKRGRRSPRRNWDQKRSTSPVPPPPAPPIHASIAPPPQIMANPNYIPQQMYQDNYGAYAGNGGYMQPMNNVMPAGYGYAYNTQQPIPQAYPPMLGQPVPPGEDFVQQTWDNQGQQPSPIVVPQETEEEKRKREAAVALEVRNQRASLKKQRDDYKRRASALKRELKILKQQRTDLCSGRDPPSPTTNSFIKENDKLQSQIQNKISTIENVIDMLNGIIGKDKTPTPPPPSINPKAESPSVAKSMKKEAAPADDSKKKRGQSPKSNNSSSPERLKTEVLESMNKHKRAEKKRETTENKNNSKVDAANVDEGKAKAALAKKFNFIHYDPELHWCQVCDVFPKTAKDYLNHLHSDSHHNTNKSIDLPWREKVSSDDIVTYPDAPTKRTPIRGLQFFVPSTSWFCKICSYWMGDLHCASLHLKSQTHADKYNTFIETTPNYEIDWLSDRQKAYERCHEKSMDEKAAAAIKIAAPVPVPAPPTPQIELKLPQPQTQTKSLFESIPLQIQHAVVTKPEVIVATSDKKEEKKNKKKKSKKDDKKDKKKKKRSKKRKRAASSSSSSSTDSSDSDSDRKSPDDNNPNAIDPANSIRAAMRNILKAQQDSKPKDPQPEENHLGKWTIVQPAQRVNLTAPPPPAISDSSIKEKKRDDLILSQWVTPEPVISDSEKKMLEQLKGKLKKREGSKGRAPEKKEEVPPPREERHSAQQREKESNRNSREKSERVRERSRDREARNDRDRGGREQREVHDRRDRRRSRSRGRRSNSRSNSYNRRFRRRSYSRSRSRSRGRRVIEKPIVNYPPEPKPKAEKKPKPVKKEEEEKKEKKSSSSSSSSQKKLPFIGRMPVFKKHQLENNGVKKEEYHTIMHQDVIKPENERFINGVQRANEDFVDDLMPDPFQYVALMGAPPPPPLPLPEEEKGEMLPPGIDDADADSVPKPISDAPIPRKGPLPKDFQEALDIIFDGEKPKPTASEKKAKEVLSPIPIPHGVDSDQPQMIHQDSIEMYGQYAANYTSQFTAYSDQSQNQPLDNVQRTVTVAQPEMYQSAPAALPKLNQDDEDSDDEDPSTTPPQTSVEDDDATEAAAEEVAVVVEEESEEAKRKRAELEDLAMLGIDADDLAAQCI